MFSCPDESQLSVHLGVGRFLRMLTTAFLTILDIFVSCFVLSPLVITYWLVTWEYMQRKIDWFPLWWTLIVSWAIQVAATCVRHYLYSVNAKFTGWTHKFFSRVYIYLLSIVGIASWRSQWVICDIYFDTDATLIALAVSLVPFALFIGSVNNLLSIPYSVGVDHHRAGLYNYTTVFNINVSTKMVILATRYCNMVHGTVT